MIANSEAAYNYRNSPGKKIDPQTGEALKELQRELINRLEQAGKGETINTLGWQCYFFEGDKRILGVIKMSDKELSIFGRKRGEAGSDYHPQLDPFTFQIRGRFDKRLGYLSIEEINNIKDVVARGRQINEAEYERIYHR